MRCLAWAPAQTKQEHRRVPPPTSQEALGSDFWTLHDRTTSARRSPSSALLRLPGASIFERPGESGDAAGFETLLFLPNRVSATRMGRIKNCVR